MKGILITILAVMLIFGMALSCLAASPDNTKDYTDPSYNEDTAEDGRFDIREYLTEKIAPIIAGVATSLVALLGGFAKLKSAVCSIDRSGKELDTLREGVKSTLSGVETQLKKGLCDIEEKLKGVPEIKESYDEIRASCLKLEEQNEMLLEALKLGFESFPEAVKCGNARKIAIMSELCTGKETEK